MTDRGLKIALGVSIAVNIFVLGAVAGGLIAGVRLLEDRPYRDRPPVIDIVRSLDESDRAALVESLRGAGLAAHDDFESARRARSEAIELAGDETFDRSAVEAALARSREAEGRGRARIEASVLDLMGRLDQEDRQRLAPSLARRGGGPDHRRGRRESSDGGGDRREAAVPEQAP